MDRAGKRRWTDCEWDLADGGTLVLEVDGVFHIEVRQQGEDFKRARRITTKNRLVVRCTSYELRHETEEVAVDLIALGVPGRVPDNAA
jgi:very-short-patch-repair endonuclease